MTYITKQLNIEAWSIDSVLDWLKGVSSYSQNYVKSFESNNVSGRKLSILELSDLREILSKQNASLNHQLTIFKSIHNLLQMRHDLNKETLHTLIFNTKNRIITIMNYISRLENCQCISNDCERCLRYARNEIISAAASLAVTYRRLISWLVRIPFTRLKPFEVFREEINNEMKTFLRLFRKRSSENFNREIKNKLKNMLECCNKMLDYCDAHCENENGKIAVAFSSCYLEKVVLRRKSPEQALGLRLTTLSDGIFTIAEIVRESAADECSHLNVEDDIISINNQIVVGWSSENIIKFLETTFNTGTVWLVLRKMPKDHTSSIKQQKNLVFIYKNQSTLTENNLTKPTHQRKHSFSDIFDLSEEFIMEDSSDEDEEDYEDFNRNKDENLTSNENLIHMLESSKNNRQFSRGGSYEKNTLAVKGNKGNMNKIAKLANKTNKNRLIRSMQNLLSFDRSRSNSAEQSSSNNEEIESKNKRKKSTDETSGKSDLFKSLFANKRWDFASNNSNKNSFESIDSPSTPNLIGIKKLDASKRNGRANEASNSSINECGRKLDDQTSSNYSPCIVKPVSRKPPIDKNKVTYKIQSQKPSMQGWLYRKKPEALSAASSPSAILTNTTNMTSSITSTSSNVSSNSSSNSKNNLIRNQINKSKWKKYWCVLTKDYITFHKNPDEKVPKDFLLLKDFEISKEISQKKHVFILYDKSKQSTNEFYTEQSDEFNEWCYVLNELRLKLVGGDSITSISSSLSSSSGYDTLGFQNETSSISSAQSQNCPASNTFNRRNNLQLQLSTIIDNQNNDQLKKNNQSPTLGNFQLQYNNSSRESSPDYSNNNSKVVSRDSSPGLNYPYLQEQETSESDAEVYSLTLCPEKQELFKEIVTRNGNKNQHKKVSSSGSLASANLGTSITSDDSNRSTKKKASCSPTSTSSSISKFVYDYHEIKNPENTFDQQQRCNSLPGSLQACVGSFLAAKHKKSNSNMSAPSPTNLPEEDNTKASLVNSPTNTKENQTTIPVQLEYNNKDTNNDSNNKTNDKQDSAASGTSKFNHNLQNLLLQFQKNSLLPKLIKKNNPHKQFFPASIITPVDQSNSEEVNSAPNSPNVSFNISTVNPRPQSSSQYNYYYQPNSNQSNCSSPLTPPTSSKAAKTTQISVQLGPKGITKINTLNLFTPDQIQFEQTEHFNKTLRRNPMLRQSTNPTPNSPSVTYRTELTILPSSFNKNRLKDQLGKGNNPVVQTPPQSSSLPKYPSSDKRFLY